MQELFAFLKRPVRQLPGFLGRVEHNQGSQYIGAHKHLRVLDAPVHMALRRKMNDPVNVILLKDPADGGGITDIRPDKRVVAASLYALQILQIARIGQLVHIDNPNLVPILPKHVMYIVRTNKTGPAGYKVCPHDFSSICLFSCDYFPIIALVFHKINHCSL